MGGDDGFEHPEDDAEFAAIWEQYLASTGKSPDTDRNDPAEIRALCEWLPAPNSKMEP